MLHEGTMTNAIISLLFSLPLWVVVVWTVAILFIARLLAERVHWNLQLKPQKIFTRYRNGSITLRFLAHLSSNVYFSASTRTSTRTINMLFVLSALFAILFQVALFFGTHARLKSTSTEPLQRQPSRNTPHAGREYRSARFPTIGGGFEHWCCALDDGLRVACSGGEFMEVFHYKELSSHRPPSRRASAPTVKCSPRQLRSIHWTLYPTCTKSLAWRVFLIHQNVNDKC